MIVRVAIDLALGRLFSYEVPEALQKKLAVGQLLSVPFGHREARGFALAIEEDGRRETGDGSASSLPSRVAGAPLTLKPVTAIVDEVPFFSPCLLELVKAVAAYTAAPIESVLKTALPASVLRKDVRPRELMFVEPALALPGVKVTKRQQWLYEQIVRLGGGWMAQLCQELKTTPASLKLLGRLGLVKVGVRAKRRDPLGNRRILPTKPLPLNPEQSAALKAIAEGDEDRSRETGDGRGRKPVLLFGVTGSGKTEIYLQAIAAELAAGRGAIVLVPEISLTPQTVQRFASRFGNRVAVLHSALSDGERYDEWHRIRSGEARVVIGPRSAVWAPVRDLGLVVVDEEHEASYKQDESPRYHARDVAVLRGRLEGARVVLGSATPSLESWMNVRRGKYALAEIRRRAGAGRLPAVLAIDMSEAAAGDARRVGAIFSQELLDAIGLRLARHEQVIVFLNRRGYSSSVVCSGCQAAVECPGCGVPYTYHRADACLRCHVCGGWIPVPSECPHCHTRLLDYRGVGTQRAEDALRKCFPAARVLRMDADSTSRKNSHDDILSAFQRQEADILIGTQMIAKGLDFPNVTLVGVLNADASLNQPDFRAAERTFQLLAQVSGRAGRAELPGEVLIQSHDPQIPVLQAAVRGDYAGFAEGELKDRREAWFPPFCHLAVVAFRSKDLKCVGAWADMYARSLRAYAQKMTGGEAGGRSGEFLVGEAAPSVLEKADGWYRWTVLMRAKNASSIVKAWRWIVAARPAPANVRLSMDIDAFNLL